MNKDWLDIAVLEDYLDGKLDAKAMNRVEREALEDPFVAEALEGLSRSPRKSLDGMLMLQKQLRERIAEQHSDKKRSLITWQRLSIAATAAVMFISVSVVFWMREENRRKDLAALPKKVDVNLAPRKEDHAATALSDLSSAKKLKDTLASDRTDVVIDRAIKTSKTEAYANLKKETKVAMPVSAQQDGNLNEVVVTATPTVRRQSILGAVTLVAPEAKTRFHGKVLAGDDGKPLPGALVQIQGTKLRTTTDSNGDFEIRTDSVMNYGALTASFIGFKNIEVRAYANEQSNLVLSPDNTSLSEVVVVGYGNAKDRAKVSQELAGRVAGIQTENNGIMIRGTSTFKESFTPVGGWDEFREYLKKKNRFSDEAKTGKSVVLSFTVDKKGKPKNIKVLMGIADKYDQEAVRLLQKGPKWNASEAQDKQLFVNIEF